MPKAFKTQITVKFREADPAQIMFFGNIFGWAHDTFESFIVDAGIPWQDWFGSREYMIPIRHTEADYERPFVPGQSYSVATTVKKLGSSSFTMKYVFLDGAKIHASVEMVHVVLDGKTKLPMPMPELIRTKFSPYLEGPGGA